ncbi:hypothetical protein [Serratia marcescens]|uniref:hypothetical protein n=1 Tax=Serratia marcescens TaxID=615 RepID=UPI003D6E368B
MRIEKMPGYGFQKIAVWPDIIYSSGLVFMSECKIKEDGALRWFKGFRDNNGHAQLDIYPNELEAIEAASKINECLINQIEKMDISSELRESLKRKAWKAVTAKQRLRDEELLMLSEAQKRHAGTPPPDINLLIVKNDDEDVKNALYEQLTLMPYLKLVWLPKNRLVLANKGGNDWSKSYMLDNQAAKYACRARIAHAFGFSEFEHWGKTKAKVREILLPDFAKRLELESVKRLLDESLKNGQKVLVAGDYIFWYEESGEVGWQLKLRSDSSDKDDGSTLWHEGTIISKNHGRIVVLPYTTSTGKTVKGHTKNAPKDGPAKPRHADEYVELPFEVLEHDKMRGLLGEIYHPAEKSFRIKS